MLLCDVRRLQAHKLADRIHDIDLEVLDGKTVSEVRKWLIYFLIMFATRVVEYGSTFHIGLGKIDQCQFIRTVDV